MYLIIRFPFFFVFSDDAQLMTFLHGFYAQLPDKVFIQLSETHQAMETCLLTLKREILERRNLLRTALKTNNDRTAPNGLSSRVGDMNVFKLREDFEAEKKEFERRGEVNYVVDKCVNLQLKTDNCMERIKTVYQTNHWIA